MGRWTIAAYYGLTGVLTSLWGASLPALDAVFGLGEGRLGTVLLLVALGGLAAMPPTGRLAARDPALLRTTAPAAAAGLLGPALSPSSLTLAASAVVFGALLGMLNVSLSVAAVDVEQRLARPVMSTLHGVWTLGAAGGGALTAGLLGVAVDVRTLIAAGAVAIAGCLVLLGRFGPRDASTVGDAGIVDAPRQPDARTETPHQIAALPVKVVLLGLIGAAAFLTEGAATDWSGIYAKRVLSANAATASLSYTAFWAAMTVARFLGDATRARLGADATLRLAGSASVCGYAFVLLAPAAHGMPVATAIAGWSLVGAGMALVWPVVASAAGAAHSGARHLSWITALSTGGGLVGPALIGFVATGSSLRTALLIPAVLALVITLAAPRTITSYVRTAGG